MLGCRCLEEELAQLDGVDGGDGVPLGAVVEELGHASCDEKVRFVADEVFDRLPELFARFAVVAGE